MNEKLQLLADAIKRGKRNDALALTNELISTESPAAILDALLGAMNEIGKRFKANEIFVPEVLISARAMKSVMELLEPKLVASGLAPKNCIVIGTVEGDLHDIGKNLVMMMLKGANFKVIDLGVNVTPQQYLDAVKEHKADIVAMSALLTTTMPSMKSAIDLIRSSDVAGVKIIIGGAPVSQSFADSVGANGYSQDAASAVDLCHSILKSA